jgi:hypothetical protein
MGSPDAYVFSCPARAQDSRRGQRPRNTPRSFPDPGGVVFPWAAEGKSGVTPTGFDPFRVGPCWGRVSGGVAPGYSIDPLRGSRVDSAEDVLGRKKAGKTPSGPLGLNCSTETSSSSSFWRAQRSEAKNLALDFTTDKQQGEMLRGVYPELSERTQHDSERSLSRTS